MLIPQQVIKQTSKRYEARTRERQRNERLIKMGRLLAADTPERVEKFLTRRGIGPLQGREVMARAASGLTAVDASLTDGRSPAALERMMGTNDLVGIAFLEAGLRVARTVGRIWIEVVNGRAAGYGTGFLVSPRLLLTNHHVLRSPGVARRSMVEFDYEVGLNGTLATSTTFALDPDTFFAADEPLDYALVAVHAKGTGGRALERYGWNPLIEEQGKTIISQWLNVIQHPNGEPKQLGMRENQLVDLLDDFLHYRTDTAPGSSGSPVYNDRWEVVGLHHSGVWATDEAEHILAIDGSRWHEGMGEHRIKWVSNEGVRISRIVAHLKAHLRSAASHRLLDGIFSTPTNGGFDDGERRGELVRDDGANGAPRVDVAADGTATWTIPLTVSVRVGGAGVAASAGSPAAATVVPTVRGLIPETPATAAITAPPRSPDEIAEAARRQLEGLGGVLGVRRGYVFERGWITDRPAIVVTLRQPGAAGARAGLPPTFEGLPVQVTGPTVEDLLVQARRTEAGRELLTTRGVSREEITYVPPEGVALKKVTRKMRVTAHVSPDAGWLTLEKFLAGTTKTMTVAMYDFGAPHVVEALEAACARNAFEKLTLVMQRGESVGQGTKANDLKDAQVVERLQEKLGAKFENAWVKIGSVHGWVSSSYHIKVAVRDRSAFWLSSGNFQSSNQPKAYPLTEEPWDPEWLRAYNREWHAVVEDSGLAEVFESFILHDFTNNAARVEEALELPSLLFPPAVFAPAAAERAAGFRYFEPFDQNRTFAVTPLLTPDNYHQAVLDLVRGAEDELLIQNQTFNAPKDGQDELKELVDAVIDRHDAGVDVKVIFRDIFGADTRKNLEALKRYGFPVDEVRVQPNCHTKGIIVDSRQVLLGSQNWSNAGVSVNRDASLLFDDAELAEYFAKIFEHDWDVLARRRIGDELLPVDLAPPDRATPEGFVRVSWKEYMEVM